MGISDMGITDMGITDMGITDGGAMKCGAGMLCLQSMIAALLHGLLCICLY